MTIGNDAWVLLLQTIRQQDKQIVEMREKEIFLLTQLLEKDNKIKNLIEAFSKEKYHTQNEGQIVT